MLKNKYLGLSAGLLSIIGLACGSDSTATTTLDMSFTGLPNLGADFVYEGWMVVDGTPVTTGRFTMDDNGVATPTTFDVDTDMAATATVFVLTIEPAQGDVPAPAATHILAGDIASGTASLSTAHGAALASDFASAAGSYVLNTPSTADAADYDQGIWWLTPTDNPFTSSLTLPTLPDGWVYEGWVVGANGPVTTGRFTDVAAEDADGAGPTAGVDAFPPFPGQDFINPAVSLIGQTAVISVEPEPDNAAGPFAIKPLVDMTVEDLAPPNTQTMVNNAAATLPSGTATFTVQ